MEHEVIGTVMPHVEIRLVSGESVYTEKGGMAWMDDGITMDTSARGGVGGALKRVFSQESIFLPPYTCYRAGRPRRFHLQRPRHHSAPRIQ